METVLIEVKTDSRPSYDGVRALGDWPVEDERDTHQHSGEGIAAM